MVVWCNRTKESRTLVGVYKHGLENLAEVTRGIVQILFTVQTILSLYYTLPLQPLLFSMIMLYYVVV